MSIIGELRLAYKDRDDTAFEKAIADLEDSVYSSELALSIMNRLIDAQALKHLGYSEESCSTLARLSFYLVRRMVVEQGRVSVSDQYPTHKCESCERTISFGASLPKSTYCPNCKRITQSVPIAKGK